MSYLDLSMKVGRIYAQALYELAEREGKLGEVFDELKAVADLYESAKDFRDYFRSPKIRREHKKETLSNALRGRVSDLVLNTLNVMIDKGRESMVNNLVDAFVKYRDQAEHRVHVFVTSAKSLTEAQQQQLIARLTQGDVKVELHTAVDPSLIAGVRVKVHDYLIDNTIRSRLLQMRRQLLAHANVGF